MFSFEIPLENPQKLGLLSILIKRRKPGPYLFWLVLYIAIVLGHIFPIVLYLYITIMSCVFLYRPGQNIYVFKKDIKYGSMPKQFQLIYSLCPLPFLCTNHVDKILAIMTPQPPAYVRRLLYF